MRMTLETLRVLRVFCQNPSMSKYGLELIKQTGVQAGTLYPILIRLEGNGWLESHWEHIDPVAAGRRPRRYYLLTPFGLNQALEVLTREGINNPNLGGSHA